MSCGAGGTIAPQALYLIALHQAQAVARRFPVDSVERLAQASMGVASIESAFKVGACAGSTSARGLMQIVLATQKELEQKWGLPHSPERVFNPEGAMLLGQTYLALLWGRYRDWEKAVRAYHDGHYPSAAEQQRASRESREYVPKWRSAMQRLESQGIFNGSSVASAGVGPLGWIMLAIAGGILYNTFEE